MRTSSHAATRHELSLSTSFPAFQVTLSRDIDACQLAAAPSSSTTAVSPLGSFFAQARGLPFVSANACSPCADANAATCNNLVTLTCKQGFLLSGRSCVALVTSCPDGKYLTGTLAFLSPSPFWLIPRMPGNKCVTCRDLKARTCTALTTLSCATGYSLISGRCRVNLAGCGDEAKFVNTTSASSAVVGLQSALVGLQFNAETTFPP